MANPAQDLPMDITFMAMHEMEGDSKILFVSDSVTDVLGYAPGDIIGKSWFDLCDDAESAKETHENTIALNGKSLLRYVKLKRLDNDFVRCECVFTVAAPIIVTCISLYREPELPPADEQPRMSAPVVQPRWLGLHPNEDQRVHMMEHLSTKFEGFSGLDLPPQGDADRAVMILNRFTRSLTVMYATHSVLDIVGVPATDLTNKSFYECISEGCLPEAVDVIERAKENDSIALLVFEWVDPRRPEAEARRRQGRAVQDDVVNNEGVGGENRAPAPAPVEAAPRADDDDATPLQRPSRPGPDAVRGPYNGRLFIAVVSCTSDGLVVILSRATVDNLRPFFAAPWAPVPYFPPNFDLERYQFDPETRRQRRRPPRPEPEPAVAKPEEEEKTEAARVTKKLISEYDLMDVIRYQAVFAWSLRSLHPGILRYAEEGQGNGKKDTPDSIKTKGEYVRHEGDTAYLKRGREWEESIHRAEEATGKLAKKKKKRAAEEDVEREDVEDGNEENDEEDMNHYMKRGYVKRRKH